MELPFWNDFKLKYADNMLKYAAMYTIEDTSDHCVGKRRLLKTSSAKQFISFAGISTRNYSLVLC